MDKEINLFAVETDSENAQRLAVINGGKEDNSEIQLKCYMSKMLDKRFLTPVELFSGYDSIHAITFSYDLDFIEKLMNHYKYGEILLGAAFMTNRDNDLHELMLRVIANGKDAPDTINKHQSLVKMMTEGNLKFRVSNLIIDHRKVYILDSDDGRRRVVTGSANMSGSAFANNRNESIQCYDEDMKAYNEWKIEFESAWQTAVEITPEAVEGKETDNLIDDNVITKKIKDTDKAIVIEAKAIPKQMSLDNTTYALACDRTLESYREIFKGIKPNIKDGLIKLNPKTIERVEKKLKDKEEKDRQQVNIRNTVENYPRITFDYTTGQMYFNGAAVDMNPSADEIKKDIDVLLEVFDNFDDFVGDTQRLKENHYKFINAFISSPFSAKLRCAAFAHNLQTITLPMFMLSASKGSNCGKTFIVRVLLKMMTGKNLTILKKDNLKEEKKEYKKDGKEKKKTKTDVELIGGYQVSNQGTPIFIDEVNNRFMSNIEELIKNPEKCEIAQLETMPMLVFASNTVLQPEDTLRKRMIFLLYDNGLPSGVDEGEYANISESLLRRLDTAFFREYARRILIGVNEFLDYLDDKNRPVSWYPDLLGLSSKTIISILKDYGYEIPPYMRTLTWFNDYSANASSVSRDALEGVAELYKENKNFFKLTEDKVEIELDGDKESKQKLQSWKNILPPEMRASIISSREHTTLIIERKPLEERLGFKFESNSFFKRLFGLE